MKTSEMIAMLEKNPKLKFKRVNAAGSREMASASGSCIKLPSGYVNLESNWELVREPVTWQEAIQAWTEGKTVRCVLGSSFQTNKSKFGIYQGKDFYLADGMDMGVSKDEIEKGTWYIEEEC